MTSGNHLALMGMGITLFIFIFGLFRWLISRIDSTALSVKQDLLNTQIKNHDLLYTLSEKFSDHQVADATVFGEIKTSLGKIETHLRGNL